jgi:preprotein translocase subunit SecG
MLTTFLDILHVFVCGVLMFVVLLQQGKGGGMGAAFGGGGAAQVFGGRGAGNLLTRATAVCATTFMLTSVSLAYLSSSGDRALRAKTAAEETKKDKAAAHPKESKADTKPSGAAAPPAGPAGGTPPGAGESPASPAAPSDPAPAK